MATRAYDLFMSYARRDNEQGRITELVERIERDFAPFAQRKLVPFFDLPEIHSMQDWRQRILQGLRESRLLLACLSPSYLQSEYCEWEFVEYLKYEIGHLHGFNGVAPIYFVHVPGWDEKDFDQRCAAWVTELRKRQHFDLRPWHEQGEEALHEAAVQERMGRLNRQISETILRGERAAKSLGNVEAHNPRFIGRIANLRMLRDNFVKPGHIGVVTAVNGVGGLGKTALAIEYAHAFADEYGGGRWLVRSAGKDDLRLALAELATPLGFEFTDTEKKSADLQFERTHRELKNLADARAPHRCLLILDNVDRPALLAPAQVARLNAGDWLHVLATTRLGENELHGAHRDRSFLAVDELPPDDALALIEGYQPDAHFRSEAERDAAREIVRSLGCFTLAVESAAVYLGQFADDVTCGAFLARLKKEGLGGLDIAAHQSSEGVLHGEKRLGATLQPTLERLGEAEKLALGFAALLPPDQVALPWLRALAIWEKSLAADHPHVASAPDNLASLLQATNRRKEAEPWYRRALAIREKALEIDDPKIIQSLEFLAGLLEATGRFEEAGPLRQRVLEAQARGLGPEHPDTLRNWNNYCFELRKQGHAGHSEPIARRVSATTAKVLGNTHPLTLHRRNNLALTLILLGRLEEARQILAADGSLNAPPHANTTPCLAFLRHVIALLESQPHTPFLGQIKTLLTGPQLPAAEGIAVPWGIAYFLEYLRPKLPPSSADFLIALAVDLHDHNKLPGLDRFPEWRNQPPISLDTPWLTE